MKFGIQDFKNKLHFYDKFKLSIFRRLLTKNCQIAKKISEYRLLKKFSHFYLIESLLFVFFNEVTCLYSIL